MTVLNSASQRKSLFIFGSLLAFVAAFAFFWQLGQWSGELIYDLARRH